MYNLLHIHNDAKFVDDSLKFVNEKFNNEIIFIGNKNDNLIAKLNKLSITYKVFQNTQEDIRSIAEYANKFDGVVFYSLSSDKVQILLSLNSKVKTFLRFFGYELYELVPEKFRSEKTLNLLAQRQRTTFINKIKRKIKIYLNTEYSVEGDNQKKIYKKIDAILMINEFEYVELRALFYLPKLIALQFTNHQSKTNSFNMTIAPKTNKVIIGNNRSSNNNHIDVLDIISKSNYQEDIEFYLFFSYGNEPVYEQKIKVEAEKIKNAKLIELFLSETEFDFIYKSAATLVINSYRQHAIGNINTAIKCGCKIYLNKKSSTYQWYKSKGFFISEVDKDLKRDLETGNIKLSAEEQQHNFDCFAKAIKDYTVNDFLENIIAVLEE